MSFKSQYAIFYTQPLFKYGRLKTLNTKFKRKRQQETRSPAVAKVGRPYRTSKGQRPTSRSGKTISQSDCSPIHAMMSLLYQTLTINIRYDTVIRRTWVMTAVRNVAFKVAAKPMQTETWLLLTAYIGT